VEQGRQTLSGSVVNIEVRALPHTIQVFSGGCDLCKETAEIVEVGKCKDCKMEVLSIEKNRELARRFGVTSVPSIVIDRKIKVVGKPTFPWFCGDEFYRKLERNYPLRGVRSAEGSSGGMKFDLLSSGGGGLGAAMCTITMLLPILFGTAGAGASVVCTMRGMCGQLTGLVGAYVNAVTPMAPSLFVVSMALILFGMRKSGTWPLGILGVGGVLVYFSMFVVPFSLPLVVVSSAVLSSGYGFAYLAGRAIHTQGMR
jgi:hypothetical protein